MIHWTFVVVLPAKLHGQRCQLTHRSGHLIQTRITTYLINLFPSQPTCPEIMPLTPGPHYTPRF